jgi:hypothetical protein
MRERLYLSLLVAVLLCLAGWTAHAQLQRSSPARQSWEYKSLVLVQTVGVGSKLTLYEGDRVIPGTPLTRIPELGAEGWELVSVAATLSASRTSSSDTSTYVYWLKRPR